MQTRLWMLIVFHFGATEGAPGCRWRRGSCSTLKCVEFGDSSALETSMKLLYQEDAPKAVCFMLEVSHSNLDELTGLAGVPHPEQFEEIRLSSLRVKRVRDAFGGFVNVTRLFLDGNQIESVSMSGLRKLEVLDLSRNRVKTFKRADVPEAGALKTLELNDNFLVEVDTCGFEQLEELNLRNNSLTGGFGCNAKLKRLNLNFNKISRLNIFSSPEHLEILRLGHNLIVTIGGGSFKHCKSLRELYLGNNRLRRINSTTFSGLERLRYLSLVDNNITVIQPNAFSDLKRLEVLELRGNKMQVLRSRGFEGLGALFRLDLSNQTIDRIDNDAFSGLKGLIYLELRSNQVHEVQDRAFHGLPKLQYLNLELHGPTLPPYAFSSLKSLEKLRFQNSDMSTITEGAFFGLTKLERLSLSGLNIQEMERATFEGLESLKYLDLSNNSIKLLRPDEFRGLLSLEGLSVSGAGVSHIAPYAFYGLERVTALHLSNNTIEELQNNTFVGLSSLTKLDLSKLGIQTVAPEAFAGLANLQLLNLSSNSVGKIGARTFVSLSQLEVLDLSHNKLAIDGNAFAGLEKLRRLNLTDNRVRVLPSSAFQGLQSLEALNLSTCRILRIQPKAFEGLNSLQVLDLSKRYPEQGIGMKLEARAFAGLPSLLRLDLNNRAIFLANGTFKGFEGQVRELNLSDLGIRQLQPRAFDGLRGLEILDLRGNWIRDLPSDAFTGLGNLKSVYLNDGLETIAPTAFSSLTCLRKLMVNNSRIVSLEADTFHLNLEELFFDNVTIDTVGPFSFRGLRGNVHFRNTTLGAIMPHGLSGLNCAWIRPEPDSYMCSLYDLGIKDLHPGAFSGFVFQGELHMELNSISVLRSCTFQDTKSYVQELYLPRNNIATVEPGAFCNLSKLHTLDLSGNDLTTVQDEMFQGLSALQLLDLSSNKIAALIGSPFLYVPKLFALVLSHNRLKTVPKVVLAPLEEIEILLLDNNSLTYIESDLVGSKFITKLVFSHNNLTSFNLKVGPPKFPRVVYLALDNNPISHLNLDSFLQGYYWQIDIRNLSIACPRLEEVLRALDSTYYTRLWNYDSVGYRNGVECIEVDEYDIVLNRIKGKLQQTNVKISTLSNLTSDENSELGGSLEKVKLLYADFNNRTEEAVPLKLNFSRSSSYNMTVYQVVIVTLFVIMFVLETAFMFRHYICKKQRID